MRLLKTLLCKYKIFFFSPEFLKAPARELYTMNKNDIVLGVFPQFHIGGIATGVSKYVSIWAFRLSFLHQPTDH